MKTRNQNRSSQQNRGQQGRYGNYGTGTRDFGQGRNNTSGYESNFDTEGNYPRTNRATSDYDDYRGGMRQGWLTSNNYGDDFEHEDQHENENQYHQHPDDQQDGRRGGWSNTNQNDRYTSGRSQNPYTHYSEEDDNDYGSHYYQSKHHNQDNDIDEDNDYTPSYGAQSGYRNTGSQSTSSQRWGKTGRNQNWGSQSGSGRNNNY